MTVVSLIWTAVAIWLLSNQNTSLQLLRIPLAVCFYKICIFVTSFVKLKFTPLVSVHVLNYGSLKCQRGLETCKAIFGFLFGVFLNSVWKVKSVS